MKRELHIFVILFKLFYLAYCEDYSVGKNFIREDGTLDSSCEDEFYLMINKVTVPSPYGNEFIIYQCLGEKTCFEYNNNLVYVKGTKECLTDCGIYYRYKDQCYTTCINVTEAPFSYHDNTDKNVCIDGCPTFYMESNKICVKSCSDLEPNKITDGKLCVEKCNLTSKNKFLVAHEDGKFAEVS